jgi:Transposase zinc-binding domain
MPAGADVFRRSGGAYLERYGQDLLPSHRRAVDDMVHGRTEALGGHLLPCDHCGQAHYVDHACRNRSGPTCHRLDTEAWLAERRQARLPVPYFHVVFTLPQELRALVRSNQNDLDDSLLRAAAQALIKRAADPH